MKNKTEHEDRPTVLVVLIVWFMVLLTLVCIASYLAILHWPAGW
jgi:uncharacterized membrane protein